MKPFLAIALLLVAAVVGIARTSLDEGRDFWAADAALQHVVDGLELAQSLPFEVQYALHPYRREIVTGLWALDVLTQGRVGLRVFSDYLLPLLLPRELGIFAGGNNCAWRLAS